MKSYSMTRFFSSSQKKIKSEAEKNWLIRNEIKQMIMHLHNPFIIFISREYIFRYEFLRLHCPLIVSQWTKPCLSKWMDIYIYINEDKYMDTIYSSLMKEGYSYCCRQWRSYVLVTFTGYSNRWFTVSGVIRTVPVEISSFESVSNLL